MLTWSIFAEKSVVKVRVGTGVDSQDFYVHKDLLSHHSPFFKAALSNERKEALENVVQLPDDDVEVFRIYICWLYGSWPFTSLASGQVDKQGTFSIPDHDTLGSAYCFGDKVLDFDFCDMVADMLCAHSTELSYCPITVFARIWKVAAVGSGPRRLIVDSYVCLAKKAWSVDLYKFEAELWQDIAEALIADREEFVSLRSQTVPWIKGDMCRYHLHASEEGVCYKKTKDWDQPSRLTKS